MKIKIRGCLKSFRQHHSEPCAELDSVSHKELSHQKLALRGVEMNSRIIKTVSLTSASGAANRAVGSIPLYRKLKSENPTFTTFDFRVLQYKAFF